MVEFINQNLNNIRWQVSTDSEDLATFDYKSEYIVGGSDKGISVWQFQDDPLGYQRMPIIEIASQDTDSPVATVRLIGNEAFVALRGSKFQLYELKNHESGLTKSLKLKLEVKNLNNNRECKDMIYSPHTNSVITCGSNGTISYFDLDKSTTSQVNSFNVADTSIKCLDLVTPNEVVCGTLKGSLIHYDLRTNRSFGLYECKGQSALTCVQRNPNVNHLIVAGNDEGFINLYDLRHQQFAIAKIPVHDAAITDLKYQPRAYDTFYSSSCDHVLMKLNMASDFNSNQKPKADILVAGDECFSINCFDVNQQGHLIYATDIEVLYYHMPQKPAIAY